jgi:RNA polymerase sigma-70 factor (ECF subfamily)
MGTLVAHTLVKYTQAGFQFDTARTATAPAAGNAGERALIAQLCAGEEAAYEVLIDRYERPVFNLVSRLTDDSADVPDVVQEVFLKVFRNVGSFRGDSSLKTWVYRIAVNESRNHRRWFGRHKKQEVTMEPRAEETGSHGDWLPDPGRSPLELAIDHEREALIEVALGEINPNFRAVLVLREIEGLNYDEIADILEISLGTVKSRILRGREALRQRLAEHWKQEETAHPDWQARTVIAE